MAEPGRLAQDVSGFEHVKGGSYNEGVCNLSPGLK
jgi:hypothetical protein